MAFDSALKCFRMICNMPGICEIKKYHDLELGSLNQRGNGQRDGETDRMLKRKGIGYLFGMIGVGATGESCHTP